MNDNQIAKLFINITELIEFYPKPIYDFSSAKMPTDEALLPLKTIIDALDNSLVVNAKDKNGATLLHLSVEKNRTQIVKYLLDCGANPNQQDKNGYTPLHYLLAKNYHTNLSPSSCVRLLLRYNASLNIRNTQGYYPLHLVTDFSVLEHALRSDEFLENIDLSIVDPKGDPLLHFLFKKYVAEDPLNRSIGIGHILFLMENFESKIKNSISIEEQNKLLNTANLQDANGDTLLILLAKNSSKNKNSNHRRKTRKTAMEILLRIGVDITIKNKNQKTALDYDLSGVVEDRLKFLYIKDNLK